MKKAFTLIEMLVVIGIIGILMSVLIVHVMGGTESARAVQCLSNLGNLARAVQQYGSGHNHYPLAGSVERMYVNETNLGVVKEVYEEIPGWISWNSRGAYTDNGKSPNHASGQSFFTSAYCDKDDEREYCLTNGALWKCMNGSTSCYTCPNHLKNKEVLKLKRGPCWSYVMNSYFKYDDSIGSRAKSGWFYGHEFMKVERADRKLLFAELQWENYISGNAPDFGTGAGIKNDCTLQYDRDELIGFNHKSGRDKVAHVVFADGHTDKILLPKGGLSTGDLKNLTRWLCTGKDFSFDGKRYKEL